MADTSAIFEPLLNPGNGSGATSVFPTPLGPSIVRRILLTFPAGCGGLVGVAVTAGGSTAFPFTAQSFFSFDDYTYAFEVGEQITTGDWGLVTYNKDFILHSVQVVFEYDYLDAGPSAKQQPPVSL